MSNEAQIILAVLAIVMSLVVGGIAKRKGYSEANWALWGLLAWPIALILIWSKPPNPKMFRRCPDCGATDVPYNVPVCRHCGRDERKVTREKQEGAS